MRIYILVFEEKILQYKYKYLLVFNFYINFILVRAFDEFKLIYISYNIRTYYSFIIF